MNDAPARRWLTVPEVATILSLGLTKTYELVAAGEIPSVTIDRARRVPARALDAWISRKENERCHDAGQARDQSTHAKTADGLRVVE